MIYQRYFKAGQKVQLRVMQPLPPEGRNELLSAWLDNGDANYFDLRLPYGPNAATQYPFEENMLFELSSDVLGLGIKVTVSYQKPLSGNRIRVLVQPDLQMFQRRLEPRIDCTIGIRYTRGKDSLLKLRETWEKNASLLASPTHQIPPQTFSQCKLNLSSLGICFTLHEAANPADICLMLLDLGDSKGPICALAEIVWTTEKNAEGTLQAGMQFIDILEQDQTRIRRFIRDHP